MTDTEAPPAYVAEDPAIVSARIKLLRPFWAAVTIIVLCSIGMLIIGWNLTGLANRIIERQADIVRTQDAGIVRGLKNRAVACAQTERDHPELPRLESCDDPEVRQYMGEVPR